MVISEDIESFREGLDGLSSNYKLLCNSLFKLKGDHVSKSMLKKGKDYLNNEHLRMERVKITYDEFSSQISEVYEDFVNKMEAIRSEGRNEIKEMENDFEGMKDEMKMKCDELKKKSLFFDKEPSFVYRDFSKSTIDASLVKQYPGSYLYKEYMSKRRTSEGNVFVDCDCENDELIVKYMKNDESLIDDVKKMNFVEKKTLFNDLSFLELPIKKNIIGELSSNEDNEIMEAWRQNRVVMVNNKKSDCINQWINQHRLIDMIVSYQQMKDIQYHKQDDTFYVNLNLKYFDVIEDYLKNGKRLNEDLLKQYKHTNASSIINEFRMIGIYLSEGELKQIRSLHYEPLFKNKSHIIENDDYDRILQEWLNYSFDWKLIYRASEHGYTASSFHECCDNKGPTLIIIKSSGGWIFGGYTSINWTSDSMFCK